MEEPHTDYRWFVESIDRLEDAKGNDEIIEIIMESIGKAEIKGQDELAAVAVLVFQYCGSQVLLHNFRRVILNIPEKGSKESSESWQATAGMASSFLNAMMEELFNLEGLARQRETRWSAAMNIADNLLGEIAQNCQDLRERLPQVRDAVN